MAFKRCIESLESDIDNSSSIRMPRTYTSNYIRAYEPEGSILFMIENPK